MWAVLDQAALGARDGHPPALRRLDSRQEKPTILVVDDSISTREIEISMLELEGYEVIGAVDGVDALEKIRGGRFDLVVSDLNMPRMDGLKLLENIRSDESLKSLPVVFVTAVDEPETRKKAESLGADKYILKSSFEQDDLVERRTRAGFAGPGRDHERQEHPVGGRLRPGGGDGGGGPRGVAASTCAGPGTATRRSSSATGSCPTSSIMDIDMPLLKGYQASRLLKTRRGVKDIPIIMHTANSEDKDRFWSYDSGACAFVVKDFEHIGPLVETVGRFIGTTRPTSRPSRRTRRA